MRTLRLTLLTAVLFLSGFALAHQGWAGTFSQIGSSRWVTVAHVYDGDTFKTRSGEKVRLLGINTPEIAHSSSPGEPLGIKAKQELQSLLQNKLVQLSFDEERRDDYGRLLAHVYLRNGTWINGRMVEAGLAHVYTFAPNFRHTEKLLELERLARSNRLGIWRSDRFSVLAAGSVDEGTIGQFRVVRGRIASVSKNGWGFRLGNLSISIPRAHRKWFKSIPALKKGDRIVVRGKIRTSNRGRLFLALHSPFDLEIMNQ